jgi:hypothetical protein
MVTRTISVSGAWLVSSAFLFGPSAERHRPSFAYVDHLRVLDKDAVRKTR